MQIADIKGGASRLYVEGTIVEVGQPRTVKLKTGETSKVANATLKDATGSIKFTLWNDDITSVSVGDQVRIENGYTTTFRGEVQLNVGKYGIMSVL